MTREEWLKVAHAHASEAHRQIMEADDTPISNAVLRLVDAMTATLAALTPPEPAPAAHDGGKHLYGTEPALCVDYSKSNETLTRELDAARAECDELRRILEWIDRKGGMGLDVHERIRDALTPTDATEGTK